MNFGQTTSDEPSPNSPQIDEPLPPKLNDGRDAGAWRSVYSRWARFWIYIELVYLLLLMAGGLGLIAVCAVSRLPIEAVPILSYRPLGTNDNVLFWTSVGAAGVLGGTVMTLKWHYHCVAKKLWHVDRRVWRITTPLLSGVVSLFVIMLLVSGVVSIISSQIVGTPIGGPAVAFVLGLFSDNILAALQNFAVRALGTLRDTKSGGGGDDS